MEVEPRASGFNCQHSATELYTTFTHQQSMQAIAYTNASE